MRFEDCKRNMKVAHISLGDGVVQWMDDELVKVTYDRMVAGKPVTGAYDRNWFETHPKYLFGRTE